VSSAHHLPGPSLQVFPLRSQLPELDEQVVGDNSHLSMKRNEKEKREREEERKKIKPVSFVGLRK